MRTVLRSLFRLAVVATGLWLSGCQSACTSAVLPPAPTAEARSLAAATSLPYAVAVERGNFPPVYAEHLADALRRTGLFASVEPAEARGAKPDLVATVLSPSEGAAVIPIWTALTLGIFPTWADETSGLRFSLAPSDCGCEPVVVDFRWHGTTVLGWASALLNLSPSRTGGDPTGDSRYAEHVAASIAPHAAAIRALLPQRDVAQIR